MPVSLTATPLPDSGAARLRLDATYDTPAPLYAENYVGTTQAAMEPYAALWSPSNADGAVAAVNGGVRLTGSATAGGTTFTRTLTGLEIGSRYVVQLWVGPSTWVQATVGGQTVQALLTTGSTPGSLTYLQFEFVASATSHALTLTPYVASQTIYLYGLNVQQYAAARIIFKTNIAASDSANWSQGGSNPTNGSRTITIGTYSTAPSGWAHYAWVEGTYRSDATGTTATYPAESQSIRRTITGLTVGHEYTVRVRGAAYSFTPDGSGSGWTGVSVKWQLGVVGIGWAESNASAGTATYTFTATATSRAIDVRLPDAFTATGGTSSSSTWTSVQAEFVVVEDTSPPSVTYSLVSLTRADNNGTRPVRMYAGQGVSAGVLITTDYEPAFQGLVSYRAVVRNTAVGSRDETVQASVDFTGSVDRLRIAPASLPSEGVWVDAATDYSAERESSTTVARVIGRVDPVVTLGRQGLRTGSETFYASDHQTALAIARTFDSGEVMFVRHPDRVGMDMYCAGTRVHVEPTSSALRWLVAVDYTEVLAPSTALLESFGWTVSANLARNLTLAASRAEFATVLDLLIGPQ